MNDTTPAPGSLRCLILDDEPLGRSNLRYALAAHPRWRIVAECEGVPQALAQLQAGPVDLAFVDIQMPGESGISLARRLTVAEEPPIVVFVTAYDRYAIEAFTVHALDYLLKPFDDQRFAMTLERAEALVRLRQPGMYAPALRGGVDDVDAGQAGRPPRLSALSVRSVGRIESVPLAEVLWISAAGNYVELHLAERTVLHRVPLSQLERRLDPAVFLRVHRSHIVRRDQCAALRVVGDGMYTLTLRGGAQLAVSARFAAEVRALLVASELAGSG